jgi:hypothetical protein
LALGLVLAGCTAIREDIQSGDSLEIKFTAQVGTFQVKATDTGLELGDQVGLFAGSPVSANNVKMTWDGTALVPETRLFWTPGDERKVDFRAYYPYDPERTNGWSEYFVNADQSTHALFTASDFMVATTASNPSDGVVSFNFRHCFSKIVIHVDNQLQDLQITDIYLSNVRGRVEGEVSEYYNTIGLPGTIKTCKATTPEGEPVWAVIIPAQSSLPQLMITTADGKQFTYQSTYDIWFNQSCSYTAYVTLKENDIFTDFTSEVTEWTDNNDLEFPMPGRENWSVYGQFQGTNWDLEFPMYNCYSGTDAYYALVYVNAGDEIKLLQDGKVNYGLEEGAKWGWGGNTLVKDGASITFDKRGVYELFWYPREKSSLEIYPVGESGTWGITGTLEGLDWQRDHMLDYSSYVTVENDVIHPMVVFDIKYRVGDEFKIRFGGDWFLEYGYDSDYWESQVIETGRFYTLRKGGPNLMLPEDGMYQVYFDPYGPYIYARWTGDLPSVVSIDEVLNGTDGETYWVGGYVSGLENTNYGNYYIADKPYGDNTLYIYGTVNSQGLYPKNSGGWFTDEFGLLPGDYVEVEGVRITYNGLVELKDVKLVSVQRLTPLGFLSNYASMAASGGETQFIFRCFGKPEVRAEADWLSCYWDYIGSDWYVLTVTVSQNEGEDRQGILNFYYDGVTASVMIDQQGEKEPATTEHAGTLEDPYSVADAIAVASTLSWTDSKNYEKTEDVYVKGVITTIGEAFGAKYGNASFYIADSEEATSTFYAYRVLYFGQQKWAEGNKQIAVGDEVIIYGPLMNYRGNTPETVAGVNYVYSINGETE